MRIYLLVVIVIVLVRSIFALMSKNPMSSVSRLKPKTTASASPRLFAADKASASTRTYFGSDCPEFPADLRLEAAEVIVSQELYTSIKIYVLSDLHADAEVRDMTGRCTHQVVRSGQGCSSPPRQRRCEFYTFWRCSCFRVLDRTILIFFFKASVAVQSTKRTLQRKRIQNPKQTTRNKNNYYLEKVASLS